MGIIRFLLALAVVLVHAKSFFGFKFIDGTMAVQIFFIISGFYMSLIINEKYAKQEHGYSLFISNRFLRLYPTYFVVIILTLLLSVFLKNPDGLFDFGVYAFRNFHTISLFSLIYLITTNITIIGQEIALFTGFDTHGFLQFVKNFELTSPQVYKFMLSPPAWSLSLEFIFYLMAPFLVKRRTGIIVAIMVLSFGLRMYLYHQGFKYDPWTYRFFPCEIFFFLAGNIAYRVYCLLKTRPVSMVLKITAWVVVVAGLLVFNVLPVGYFVKQWIFYLVFVGALPFIFLLTKRFLWDRTIGELSYPIYITHWMAVFYCVPLINQIIPVGGGAEGVLAVGITVAVSLLIMKFVVDPVEKIRSKRVKT